MLILPKRIQQNKKNAQLTQAEGRIFFGNSRKTAKMSTLFN